jgi:hypothetical protein
MQEFECGNGCRAAFYRGSSSVEAALVKPSFVGV